MFVKHIRNTNAAIGSGSGSCGDSGAWHEGLQWELLMLLLGDKGGRQLLLVLAAVNVALLLLVVGRRHAAAAGSLLILWGLDVRLAEANPLLMLRPMRVALPHGRELREEGTLLSSGHSRGSIRGQRGRRRSSVSLFRCCHSSTSRKGGVNSVRCGVFKRPKAEPCGR